MCTSGTVAQVLPAGSGEYDYANMGFAGIGFNLNQTEETPGVFDATQHGVVGFAFEIDAVPPALRVQVATPESPTTFYDYWGADMSWPNSPVVAGRNVVMFSDVRSPEADPQPVDTTRLEGVHFLVPGNTETSVPFSYCISHIELNVKH